MKYEAELTQWVQNTPEDPDLAAELSALRDAVDSEGIEDRFYRSLSFGTGGLRGVIGAGTARMNVYTVGQATQGLAQYLLKNSLPARVAIGHDSRIKSRLFAQQAARVLAANGIEALLYPRLQPTPALSYAVRRHGCGAGICVTASHNPAQYNGYKVYGPDGCQITDAAAGAIQAEIAGVDIFGGVKRVSLEEGRGGGRIRDIGEDTLDAYLAAVAALRLTAAPDDTLSVVYTPLCGAGLECVTRTLAAAGVAGPILVSRQKDPDGNFPTCPYPNPEEPEAMQLGLELCREVGADLLLATDPDCDRVGIAVKAGGDYTLLSGNEVGVLLLDYICRMRLEKGAMPERPLAVKTIVTTEMAEKVAERYGVELVNVLTGFKYIGEQIGRLEAAGEAGRFIFGFEESYGYLSGTHARDKDAVNASLLICDMAQDYKRQGLTLAEAMERLYRTHGYHIAHLDGFTFEGAAGFEAMQAMMKTLRAAPPQALGGREVERVLDYLWRSEADAPLPGLPASDVLQFKLEGGACVTVRPSGTEPKIKVYYSATGPTRRAAEKQLARLQAAVTEVLGL